MNLTPWSTEQPIFPGWYTASTCEPRVADYFRHWNGIYWSAPIHHEDMSDPIRLERARVSKGETQDDIVWRGIDAHALTTGELNGLAAAYLVARADDYVLREITSLLKSRIKEGEARLRQAAIALHRRSGAQPSERAPKWLKAALQAEPLTA